MNHFWGTVRRKVSVSWLEVTPISSSVSSMSIFFSSRRRHTRSLCDWSSDVCSSDLYSGLIISIIISLCVLHGTFRVL